MKFAGDKGLNTDGLKRGIVILDFFHSCATIKKNKLMIASLNDPSDDTIVSYHKEKALILFGFYKNLMGSNSIVDENFPILKLSNIFFNHNVDLRILENPITVEKLDFVVKKWKLNKTPGPDDINGEFMKKYWSFIKQEVMEIISTHNVSEGMGDFGISFIALIPNQFLTELTLLNTGGVLDIVIFHFDGMRDSALGFF